MRGSSMIDTEFLGGVPAWAKYIGTALGSGSIAFLALRQWLSKASLNRTVDEATEATIKRLQDMYTAERDRADALMRDRETMATKIGELEGKVDGLTRQVEMLTQYIRDLRGAKS